LADRRRGPWSKRPRNRSGKEQTRAQYNRPCPENSIQLDEPSVSGRHAELALIAENVYLKDLGSTNGTLVNDRSVTDAQLRAGDRIRFGKVEACFECEVASAAQPLPRLAETEAHPAESSARPLISRTRRRFKAEE